MNKYLNQKILLLTFIATLLTTLTTTFALADNNQRKQNQLQRKINTVSSELKGSRAISTQLKKRLTRAENKLNTITRELHKTNQEAKRLTKKLNKLNQHKDKLLSNTSEQKQALAQQMQALYTSGKQSHLRLLLKQDDPSDIGRTSKYFEYMNKYRLKKINKISKKLKSVKRIQAQINKDNNHLNEIQQQQKAKKKKLKSAVSEKERALKKQRKVVVSQEQQLRKIKKQESRLKGVIERLAIKQRREAERRKVARQRASNRKQASNKAKKSKSKEVIASVNSKKKSTRKLTKTKLHYVPNKPFSSLKGKLSWPVRGRILHRYGSVKNAKQRWNAVVITAPGGAAVRAVARGKVEYSGRLKGYGFVVIIRHDKNYRSIYGYNRSVFKREGQIVKAGEAIAAVGNSGRLSKTALYFEIRKKTKYQNPARWCK